jgi:hypothetical protein
MNPAPLPSPEVCPLCGQSNQCALEIERATGQKQDSCWCTQATFSADLLSRLPDNAVNRACICARCASGQSRISA